MSSTIKNNKQTLLKSPLEELIKEANNTRKTSIGNKLHTCAILNARSGLCTEDCRFCAQSARYSTGIQVYPLKENTRIVRAAQQAKAIGAERFGIVTSGNRLTDRQIDRITEAVSLINENVGIPVCASLGALEKSQLQRLKDAGLRRYHHNIETSKRFYPEIVSTHTFDERINTITVAKDIALEVCSGGIIGMGESWADRLDMAYTLKQLDVDSIPINILIPIKGTPLASAKPVTIDDVLRTICIFRIILKDKTIKIAAGREAILKNHQIKAFAAGANGLIIGGYLTVKGAPLNADYQLIEQVKRLWTE